MNCSNPVRHPKPGLWASAAGFTILFLVLWIPLAFVPGSIPLQNSTSVVLKETSFALLAPLAFCLVLLTLLFHSEPRRLLPRLSFQVPAILLMIWIVALFFFAPYPSPALVESHRWCSCLGLALATSLCVSDSRFRDKLWGLTLFTSGLVSIYAIVQFYEFDVFEWGLFEWSLPLRRVCASFGNPNFLGGYLVLTLPLTLAALSKKKENQSPNLQVLCLLIPLSILALCIYRKGAPTLRLLLEHYGWDFVSPSTFNILLVLLQVFVWLVPLVTYFLLRKKEASSLFPALLVLYFQVIALLLTFSYGSIGAALGGCGLYLVLRFASRWKIGESRLLSRSNRKYLMAGLCLLVLLGLFGMVFAGKTVLQAKVSDRLEIYRGTLEMIAKHPVSGFGPGMYALYFPEYRPTGLAIFYSLGEFYIFHAHNEYLEMGASIGLVGLGLFFWILLAVLLPALNGIIRGVGEQRLGRLQSALVAAILAMLVYNMVSVNMRQISTACIFWILLGWLGGILTHSNKVQETTSPRRIWLRAIIALPLIGIILINSFFIIRNYIGDLYLVRGIVAHNNLAYRQARDAYRASIRMLINPTQAYYSLASLQYTFKDYGGALESYRKTNQVSRNFADVDFNIGTTLVRLERYKEALPVFERAIKINPNNPRLRDYYSRTLLLAGRSEECETERKKAIELYKQAISQPVHEIDARLYHGLGKNLMFEEQWEEAEYYLRRAIDLDGDEKLYRQSLIEFKRYRSMRTSRP